MSNRGANSNFQWLGGDSLAALRASRGLAEAKRSTVRRRFDETRGALAFSGSKRPAKGHLAIEDKVMDGSPKKKPPPSEAASEAGRTLNQKHPHRSFLFFGDA